MKWFKFWFIGLLSLGYYVPQSLTVEAALRNETKVINTTNLTDSQVHAYYGIHVTEGMTGNTLKTALNNRIKGHTPISPYSETKYAMAIVDRDYTKSPLANGTSYDFSRLDLKVDGIPVEDPYLRLMYGKYNGTPNAFQWSADHQSIWNKEHTWAKSIGDFGETAPAGTDLHHLISADQNNNLGHLNLDFGDVVSEAKNILDERKNISGKTGYSSLSSSKKVYEPADEYKGDIARMMFYMATRYITFSSKGNPQLRLVEGVVGGGSAYASSEDVYGEFGILSHYLRWNEEDPVDDYEIKRNNLIYHNFQNNRNPYIDHPEWANIVFNPSYTGSGATLASETSSVGTNPAWFSLSNLTLSSISVNITGMNTSYGLNEPFDSSGLIVTATMSDDSTKVVTGWTTDFDGVTSYGTSGNKTVTVNYTEAGVTRTSSFSITVQNNNLTALTLDTTNVTTTFPFQGIFQQDELVVSAIYSDTSAKVINVISYGSTNPNLSRLGPQNITISYAGFSASYLIDVTFQGADLIKANDLFFSEYMEGSSFNKYLEIFNGTGFGIDLEDYQIKLFSNGAVNPSNTLNLTGTLPNDEVLIIYHPTVSGAILDQLSSANYKIADNTVINFNGDDALGLYLNDVLIDRIGTPGIIGPWSGTDVNNVSYNTTNRTLVRTSGVYQGNITYAWSGNTKEWLVFPQDNTTNLGFHSFSSGAPEAPSIAYGEFFLNISSPYCEDLNGNNIPWNNLASEYNFLDNNMKDYFATTTQSTIVDARLRYVYLINKYANLNANNFLVNGNNAPIYSLNKVFKDSPTKHLSTLEILIMFGLITPLILIIKSKKAKLH